MSGRVVGITGLFSVSAILTFAAVALAVDDNTEAAVTAQNASTCPAFPTTTVPSTPTTVRPGPTTSSPSTGTTTPGQTTIPGQTTVPGPTTSVCNCP